MSTICTSVPLRKAAAHAWRIEVGLVSRLRLANALGRESRRRSGLPRLRRFGPASPRHRLVREMPYEMERIDAALMKADLFVSIGTSGAVYPPPASSRPPDMRRSCDRDESRAEPRSFHFNESRIGKAGELVPIW